MTVNDPWAVLGLAPGSSLDEARAARRRLAKRLHPDLHGDGPAEEAASLSARMTLVNQALDAIEGGWIASPVLSPARPEGAEGPAADAAIFPNPVFDDTFSVDWLPAEAFEALFLAAYGLGDILVADEPYLLELYLLEPSPCFCRLALVPEAGGSIVTVDVTAADGGHAPTPAAVIEVLVTELNALVSG